MTDLSLRPRSATELVDAAFQIFRRDPVQFIVAAAIAYVPLLVLLLVFDPTLSTDSPDPTSLLIGALSGLVAFSIADGAISLMTRDVYLERKLNVAAAYRTIGRRLVPLVATNLIAFFLIVIGAIPFLVTMFYPLARLFAVRQAVVIENVGVRGALARSSALSVNLKWHILGTLLLAFLVATALRVGSSLIISMIPSRVLLVVSSTAIAVVVYPFLAITETLLYFDARIRREGFDVEYLAGREQPLEPATDHAS